MGRPMGRPMGISMGHPMGRPMGIPMGRPMGRRGPMAGSGRLASRAGVMKRPNGNFGTLQRRMHVLMACACALVHA